MTARAAWILTALVVALHVAFAFQAGALWRDEAHTVVLASRGTLPDLWASLEQDSFPILSALLLRAWTAVAGDGDGALRALGCAVGLALVASLWLAARRLSGRAPLVALAFLGFNAMAIRAADSIRPHGLGSVLAVLALVAFWQLVRAPGRGAFLLAALAAVASVQCLYQNSVLVLGAGAGAIAVALRRGTPRRAGLVVGAGALAALSLVPYVGLIGRARQWGVLIQVPVGLERVAEVTGEALASPSFEFLGIGLLIVAAGVVAALRRVGAADPEDADLALFCLTTLVVSSAGYAVLLLLASVAMEPWYLLPLLAVAAVCVDAPLARVAPPAWLAAGAVVVAILALPPAWSGLRLRQTNVDAIAARLARDAAPDDLIVVQPWYLAITFTRYYDGAADWTALPPLADHAVHRYDLLKARLAEDDPVAGVLRRVRATLDDGHAVWFLDALPRVQARMPVPPLGAAPHPVFGWWSPPHFTNWAARAALAAPERRAVRLEPEVRARPHEAIRLERAVRP